MAGRTKRKSLTASAFTKRQARFLSFFKDPARNRIEWLKNGKHLRPVALPMELDPEAERVRVFRLSGGTDDEPPLGDVVSQASLSVAELAELDACWDEPLVSLNEHGRKVVDRCNAPMVTQSFRLTDQENRHLKWAAQQRGWSLTDLIRHAIQWELSNGAQRERG